MYLPGFSTWLFMLYCATFHNLVELLKSLFLKLYIFVMNSVSHWSKRV